MYDSIEEQKQVLKKIALSAKKGESIDESPKKGKFDSPTKSGAKNLNIWIIKPGENTN